MTDDFPKNKGPEQLASRDGRLPWVNPKVDIYAARDAESSFARTGTDLYGYS